MSPEPKNLDPLRWRPHEARKRKRRRILFSGMLLAGILLLTYFFLHPLRSISPPMKESEPIVVPQSLQSDAMKPPAIEGEIKQRQTFFQSLTQKKIPMHWIELVISKLKPYVNFKKIKGGIYRLITDERGEMVKFIYEANPTEVYEIERGASGYWVQKKKVPLEVYLVKVSGEIKTSLFEAMESLGEEDGLTLAFAEVLAWEIDFYKDVRQGDRFKVVVEKVYKKDQFIQYGMIHAVEYQQKDRVIRGIHYKGDYYNEEGISLRKAFLKTPLRFTRISSRFSQARRHPILGGVFPHHGVDYAAPIGTPVWAVGDGIVVQCGWNGGFGKQVVLKHRNGYMTYYGHLSNFARGIKKGVWVKQKQIIGYVGSTGLSTGPHLDYRLAKEGRFRNPLREKFFSGTPIEKKERVQFQAKRDEMLTWLQGEQSFKKRMGEGIDLER